VRRYGQILAGRFVGCYLERALAAGGATKDEAVAMVQKAIAAIKTEGVEKAYAEISGPQGPFVDRDLYIVVYRMDGLVLAHGADKTRIGVDLLHDRESMARNS
jgi:cytochrome c